MLRRILTHDMTLMLVGAGVYGLIVYAVLQSATL